MKEIKIILNIFSRLRAELAKLRRMYEEETEKAKKEFMYLHSTKVDRKMQEVQVKDEQCSQAGENIKG